MFGGRDQEPLLSLLDLPSGVGPSALISSFLDDNEDSMMVVTDFVFLLRKESLIATYICSIHNVTIVTFRKSERQLHMRVYGQLTGIVCILSNEKKKKIQWDRYM